MRCRDCRWFDGDGWSRPMVGVASKPCRHFEKREEE